MWQITVMNWVFKLFKYPKEKAIKLKSTTYPFKYGAVKGELYFMDGRAYMANEDIPNYTPFKEGTTGATWGLVDNKSNTALYNDKFPKKTVEVDDKIDDTTYIEPTKNESYPGFDAGGKMIFDDEPKANKKYWVDKDLESTKHLMRMQKMVAKSIRDDQSLLNTLKREIQKLYLLCKPDVNTIPMQMTFMALNTLRDEQRAVKKRLANNASTAYWLKQQLK
jgi:hypothetical protein